jgi:putative membrane protein
MRSLCVFFSLFWRGFLMGTADLVPGVSGGTIALLTGIYEPLIESISHINSKFFIHIFTLKWKKAFKGFAWKFLLPLLCGLCTALVTLTHLVVKLLETPSSKELLFSSFFALVIASIFICLRSLSTWHMRYSLFLFFGIILAYSITSLNGYTFKPSQTPQLWVLISGILAASAMLLPGISGSTMLMLLGVYPFALAALHGLTMGDWTLSNLSLCFTLIAGILIGLSIASRTILTLLQFYHNETLACLAGFMAGALLEVWPFQTPEPHLPSLYSSHTWLCIGIFFLSFLLVASIEYLHTQQRKRLFKNSQQP